MNEKEYAQILKALAFTLELKDAKIICMEYEIEALKKKLEAAEKEGKKDEACSE